MAGPDPRRSSRSRTTQSQSQLSSTSRSSSGRPDRNPNPLVNVGSPQKSTPSASLSSEPPEESIVALDDTIPTRRRTRGQPDERDKTSSKLDDVEMTSVDDDIQEDDEAVRCICGFDDYPGPPPRDDDARLNSKETIDLESIYLAEGADDLAGFFVQCDICKVWQHGACVGITNEESSPEEYFCEECRKEFHKIYTAKNGQRYSHYLPLIKRHSRTTSRAGSLVKDGTRSPKERDTRSGRLSSAAQASKRRSTMNSREAAYDEAEALRRAIEESKEEAMHDRPDGTVRRPKRARSDSEEKQENAKRQRTSSRSVSPSADRTFEDSDDDPLSAVRGSSLKSRSRNATIRNQRVEKLTEREERERQRAEAANKRKGRAERRRGDGNPPGSTILVKPSESYADTDSDPSEEMPLAARAAAHRITHANPTVEIQQPPPGIDPPVSEQPSPDTPPTNGLLPNNSSKKSSRSHKKKARNQYSKDREGPDEESPARSQSRDIQKDDNGGNGGGSTKSAGTDNTKASSKAKPGMSSRTTMSDMRRRAAALLDFISRTQLELAGEGLPGLSDESPRPSDGTPSLSGGSSEKKPPDNRDSVSLDQEGEPDPMRDGDFQHLSCMEMMDSLTTRLVKWQQEYSA